MREAASGVTSLSGTVAVQAGDLIVYIASGLNPNGPTALAVTPSGGGLAWTGRSFASATMNNIIGYMGHAIATTTGNVTVNLAVGGTGLNQPMLNVLVLRPAA